MPGIQMIIARWLLVMTMGWLISCSMTEPAIQEKPLPLPPPPSPQIVEEVQESPPQKTTPEVVLFSHKVRWRRETLYSIAIWYTGSGSHWKRLADANPAIRPKRIRIGDTIVIPEDLLRRRQPMTADFLRSISGKKKSSSPQISKPSPKKEEIMLFGPIESDSQGNSTEKSALPVPLETLD